MKAAALLLILPCAVYACQGGAPSSSDSTTLTADRLGLQSKALSRPAATVTAGAPSSPRGYFGDATSPSPPEAEFSAASADHGASQASTADDALQNVNAATTAAPTMVIRIGQAFIEVDQAVGSLSTIGKVETVNSTAQDVGEEFVDVSARVNNARRLENRLITLLSTRTGKLDEVLRVERELARVREEIERYEGRLRYLSSRVATSTLTITVHEPAPILGNNPGENPIARALRRAWKNFIALVAGVIASLGVVIPLALVAVAGWVGYRRWRRRQISP